MASAEAAVDWLCSPQSKVSCHYLVDEKGVIVQMVEESMRAWHAGVSMWDGESDINSASIGIEIHNPGHQLGYAEFTPEQMEAVAALSRDITARYEIKPENVLAHSDVAPLRKSDPGEKFNWRMLHEAGVGLWVEPKPIREGAALSPGDEGESVREVQARLRAHGYGIDVSGRYDGLTEAVVRAFQRHFRQERVDAIADRSTLETLCALSDARTL
jgi:N-acetylmuramoyl-L-alanine amidase